MSELTKEAAKKAIVKKTAEKKAAVKKALEKKASPAKKAPEKESAAKAEAPAVPAIGEGYEFVHDLDQYLYDKGVHYEIFRKLGAHPSMKDGRKGIHFAVWAPHAAAVHLIGEFN